MTIQLLNFIWQSKSLLNLLQVYYHFRKLVRPLDAAITSLHCFFIWKLKKKNKKQKQYSSFYKQSKMK